MSEQPKRTIKYKVDLEPMFDEVEDALAELRWAYEHDKPLSSGLSQLSLALGELDAIVWDEDDE